MHRTGTRRDAQPTLLLPSTPLYYTTVHYNLFGRINGPFPEPRHHVFGDATVATQVKAEEGGADGNRPLRAAHVASSLRLAPPFCVLIHSRGTWFLEH